MYSEIKDKLHFINISIDELSLFDWKPPHIYKSYILDLNIVKENSTREIFFHINKGNMKIVYIRKNSLIYSIGSNQDMQFQILEAILEKVDEKLHEKYDIEVIFSYGNITASIFKNFDVQEIIDNIKDLDLIKKVDVFCRVCKVVLPLYVKKSIMRNATSFPVPIVYTHQGHAVLCYIDKEFIVRGVELVNITG